MKTKTRKFFSALWMGLLTLYTPLISRGGSEKRPNVLFFAIDDLRPQTAAYGKTFMKTPHMDRLAAEGRLFQRHYVPVPTCAASRYGLLTGQLPYLPESFGNNAFDIAERGEAPPSFPKWFRDHGYYTVQTGKVTHSPDGYEWRRDGFQYFRTGDTLQIPGAWDELITPAGKWETPWFSFFGYDCGDTRRAGYHPPMESVDVDDQGYPDALLADEAVAQLALLAEREEPFLYAVGFYKPHLPFTAPQKYWDLYDRDEIELTNVDLSRRGGGEFWSYAHSRNDLDDPNYARDLHHGYYASVSYVDAQVGKVLDALDELGLRENTIVVLWGDHGYHLGERGHWGKHTPYEYSMRSAFIIRTPGMLRAGEATEAVTGSVDIYPTLVELAGLPKPAHLDGTSFAAVLDDPDADPVGFALGFWENHITLRNAQYRLVDSRLYETAIDPTEENDLSNQHPEVFNAMRDQRDALLAARMAAQPPPEKIDHCNATTDTDDHIEYAPQ